MSEPDAPEVVQPEEAPAEQVETLTYDELLEAAEAENQEGRLSEAEAFARRATRLEPEEPRAKIALANIATRTGRPALGIRLLQEVLEADPQSYPALRGLAMRHAHLGNFDQQLIWEKEPWR